MWRFNISDIVISLYTLKNKINNSWTQSPDWQTTETWILDEGEIPAYPILSHVLQPNHQYPHEAIRKRINPFRDKEGMVAYSNTTLKEFILVNCNGCAIMSTNLNKIIFYKVILIIIIKH